MIFLICLLIERVNGLKWNENEIFLFVSNIMSDNGWIFYLYEIDIIF